MIEREEVMIESNFWKYAERSDEMVKHIIKRTT